MTISDVSYTFIAKTIVKIYFEKSNSKNMSVGKRLRQYFSSLWVFQLA